MKLSVSERIYTKRLILEKFKKADYNFFMNLTADPVVKRFFPNFQEAEKCNEYFWKEICQKQDSKTFFLVIRLNDGYPIGLLNIFYTENGNWIVESIIAEAYRNKGYITEVLTYIILNTFEFCNMFFIKNDISTLTFEIDPQNIASQKTVKNLSKNLHKLLFLEKNSVILVI